MNEIKSLNEFKETIKKDFVMVIAKSHTCTSCQTILGMMERNVPNIDQIDIYSAYIDDLDEVRGEFLVFSVPTVLIFSEGKELLRESRYIDYNKITRLIDLYKN